LCGAPFVAGIAPPRSGAETRYVDEHPVEAAGVPLDPFVALARQRSALGIVDPGAAQSACGMLEPAGRDVAGDELTAVGHAGGERQGLAAGPGAEIDDPHPWPGIGKECRDLRAFVLDLDEAVLERGEAAERRAGSEPQADRRPKGRLG
jgi:hypothetical protein